MLSSPTCVGFRYESTQNSPRHFSCTSRNDHFRGCYSSRTPFSGITVKRICLLYTPTRLHPYTDHGPITSSAVLTWLLTFCAELRNINPISIAYAFRPQLRSRLTLPGRAVCRNPWAYGEGDSHPFYRYSYQQQLLSYLHQCSRSGFTDLDNAPLPRKESSDSSHPQLRFYTSAPLRFRRNIPRPVSYYAFFKG